MTKACRAYLEFGLAWGEQPDSRGAIVVGVDGSDAALAAVRWAAVEARLRRRGIRLVHATDEVSLSSPKAMPAI